MSTPSGIDIARVGDVAAREDDGQTVHIREANGDPAFYVPDGEKTQRPVTVRIVGSYSALYRRLIDQQKERMLKSRRATLSADLLARNQLELVAACILGWEGFTNGGKPAPCTRENVLALLERAPWIRYQLEEAQEDHAGFFGKSSAS